MTKSKIVTCVRRLPYSREFRRRPVLRNSNKLARSFPRFFPSNRKFCERYFRCRSKTLDLMLILQNIWLPTLLLSALLFTVSNVIHRKPSGVLLTRLNLTTVLQKVCDCQACFPRNQDAERLGKNENKILQFYNFTRQRRMYITNCILNVAEGLKLHRKWSKLYLSYQRFQNCAATTDKIYGVQFAMDCRQSNRIFVFWVFYSDQF